MTQNRLRSIVPMFGGGTNYVETLTAIIDYVKDEEPTTDELVTWHRGTFANVSSRQSILKRLRYLETVGFLQQSENHWQLGQAGNAYVETASVETIIDIMCDRNVGLRSLLYALAKGPMTLAEVSDQQLDTHPELGWSPEETDMARQRVNWLRSLGLVAAADDEYVLTDAGERFVQDATSRWGNDDMPADYWDDLVKAGTYETRHHARTVDPEFRATVFSEHGTRCPVSGVDHPALLDVAHILSWSDYPGHRGDLTNVLPLSKTHHTAFDRHLFTIDGDYRMRINPSFETESDLLRRTIRDRAGDRLSLPEDSVNSQYLAQHNESLEWY